MKTLDVVAAVILFNEKILCAQKGPHKYDYLSNKFEFPGGKIELNEDPAIAIIREIKEELNLTINTTEHLITIYHTYPDFKICLHAFVCTINDIGQLKLNEHIDIKWLNAIELDKLTWAAADIPIVNHLIDRSSYDKSK